MGNPKIQHFVPQFFQRYFSCNDDGKTIGMFRLDNETFKKSTSIRSQSFRAYQYGKSGTLEAWLSELETKSAPIFKAMWSNEQLPIYGSERHRDMLHFILVLDARNPIRFDAQNNMSDLIRNTKDSNGRSLSTGIIDLFEHNQTEEGQMSSLTNVSRLIPDVLDLKYKLLKNTTAVPFIISDNPLLIYNQLLEQRKGIPDNHHGYGSKGLQLFLPLNGQYMLMVYDATIYRVGNNKERVVEINQTDSINQFNLMQFLNSTNTVNFNHRASEHNIRRLFEKSTHYNKSNQVSIDSKAARDSGGNVIPYQESIFLLLSGLQIGLKVQKIKLLSGAVTVKLIDGEMPLRDGVKIGNKFVYVGWRLVRED